MARKAKYDWGRSRDSRYQKFETRLYLDGAATHDDPDATFIDVAQCLSLVNRKLVRQGQVFKIKNMRVFGGDGNQDDVQFRLAALPRTWMMFNAYKKGRSLWNQMNLEAIDALGSGNLPKYYDYKVFFDREHFDNHHNNDGGQNTVNLLPRDGDGNLMSGTGEWVYSKYETSASTPLEMNCHMLGTHSTAAGAAEGSSGRDLPDDGGSIGLVLAYQQSRGAAFTDQDLAGLDQNVDIDSPWAQLFAGDTQMQEVLTDLDADNDAPPYPADYAGGIEHPEGTLIHEGVIGPNTMGPTRVPTFEAPLGLLKFEVNTKDVTTNTDFKVMFDTEIIGAC